VKNVNPLELVGVLAVVIDACRKEEKTDKSGPQKKLDALASIMSVGPGSLDTEGCKRIGETIEIGLQLLKLWKAF